jgi:hypothetical protein
MAVRSTRTGRPVIWHAIVASFFFFFFFFSFLPLLFSPLLYSPLREKMGAAFKSAVVIASSSPYVDVSARPSLSLSCWLAGWLSLVFTR